MIARETVDKVFAEARVEEVIAEFVNLKRSGANLKGLSPFSEEKTPSFMVSPAKQIWKDFSSGKGGNVVTFVMEMEHFSFPEAIRYLAKKYNIEINEDQRTPEQDAVAEERESMYVVSEFAAKWFTEQMLDTANGKAIAYSYFKERGLRDDVLEKFALGYNPDAWTAFTDAALAKGFQLEFLDKTGLTIVKEDGKKFDRFKGRVIFPIHSFSGRVTGFGGRTLLRDKAVAKYLNSPDSIIYHKSDILYGLYQAKSSIIRNDNCFLVEGYMDVISMHQAGIENVVASSGTSLTEGQIRLIKRLTPNITVLYDGDAAGIRASFRGVDMLLEADMNVRVLTFPDGDDPDSFSRKVSTTELKAYLSEEQKDFINFKTSLLLEGTQGDPILKAKLAREIVNSISKVSDAIKREFYVKECARMLDLSEVTLFRELAQTDKRLIAEVEKRESFEEQQRLQREHLHVIQGQEEGPSPQNVQLLLLEQEMLKAILLYGAEEIEMEDMRVSEDENGVPLSERHEYKTTVIREIIESLEVDRIDFSQGLHREIFEEIRSSYAQGIVLATEHFVRHTDMNKVALVSDLMAEKYILSDWSKKNIYVKEFKDYSSHYIKDLVLRYKDMRVKTMVGEILSQIQTGAFDAGTPEYAGSMTTLKDLCELRVRLNEELGHRVV